MESSGQPPVLSVVVPFYNEAGNIRPLIDEIRAALAAGPGYEVVCVDDGSDDATPGTLAALAGDGLRVIRHQVRCGQSTALWTGVRAARADWVVTLDGDGQNDPADIVRLLEARDAAGSDDRLLVTGHRKRRQDSWWKRVSSRVANGVRGRLLGDQTPDTGCGLKLFSRPAYLDLPYFDHMHRFIPALFLRAGGKVISIEVGHRPRRYGRSKYGTFDRLWIGIVDLFGVMWLRARMKHPEHEESGRAA